ncbi:zinc finger protein 586-like isoform X2 [Colias croceus]|uniref:zinc finger protein 586-like isoform X1 n=1 Tax=Colias crocea TaxID=72248 RepID=UPI001E281708|nr:zinc finger protein 586-like isoform X1 [Colias croceus]XP_045508628.1 zinc finger protein 586-like isoform X2 [Colias croceus]
MLHNNQFGPNDVSGQTNLTSEQNLQNNVNNQNKATQQLTQSINPGFNIPDYSYGLNMNAGISHYPNFQTIGLPQNFLPQNPMHWQNNVMPMNLNIQNGPYGIPFERKFHKETTFLNVPQVTPKYKHADTSHINNYQQFNHNFVFNNQDTHTLGSYNENSARNMKNIDNFKHYMDNNLDLTVKLSQKRDIDKSKHVNETSNSDNVILKDCLQRNKDVALNPSKDAVCMKTNNILNTNKESDKIEYSDFSDSFSMKSYKDSDSRKRSLEKTLRMLEISIINSTNSRQNRQEESSLSNPTNFLNTDNRFTDNTIIEKTNETEQSENGKVLDTKKCVKNELKPETLDVKKETMPNVETDTNNPFQRDCFGVRSEAVFNCNIFDSEIGQTLARELINNGTTTDSYFECPYCSLFFNNPKRFLIHTKWHSFGLTNEKRFELQREKEVKRQMKKEARILEKKQQTEVKKVEEPEDYSCKLCQKTFNTYGSLKNHRQKVHPTRSRNCKICGKSILGWVAMKAHLATHDGADSGFHCPECPKRFKHAHSLAKHRDTHKEKTQACSQCPKKFGSTTLLNIHMKTHERMQRGATFRCTYCGKGYFESFSLAAHERTHRNEKPFQCDICSTRFGTNSSLKRHLKVSHSTNKPFVCSTCHRSFMSEAIRDRHELRYHGNPEDFKYPCNMCPSKYFELKDLKKHLYKVHPKVKRKKHSDSDCSDE